MCVWQTFQSDPNHTPATIYHLPFTKKTKPQPQNKTAVRIQCVCVMCYVICAILYVLCAMCQPQWPDPNSTRLRFKYQLNRTIWRTQKKCCTNWKIAKYTRFFSPVTKQLFLATVYNDTAHLMGSLWVLVYLAKRFVDFLLLFLQHFSLAMGLFCPKFIKLLDCSQQSRKKKKKEIN